MQKLIGMIRKTVVLNMVCCILYAIIAVRYAIKGDFITTAIALSTELAFVVSIIYFYKTTKLLAQVLAQQQ